MTVLVERLYTFPTPEACKNSSLGNILFYFILFYSILFHFISFYLLPYFHRLCWSQSQYMKEANDCGPLGVPGMHFDIPKAPSHGTWPCTLWEARPEESNTFSSRNTQTMPSPTLGHAVPWSGKNSAAPWITGSIFLPDVAGHFPATTPLCSPLPLCGVSSLQRRMCNQELQFRPRSRMLSLIYKAYTQNEPSIWFVLFVHTLFS